MTFQICFIKNKTVHFLDNEKNEKPSVTVNNCEIAKGKCVKVRKKCPNNFLENEGIKCPGKGTKCCLPSKYHIIYMYISFYNVNLKSISPRIHIIHFLVDKGIHFVQDSFYLKGKHCEVNEWKHTSLLFLNMSTC